MKKLVLVLVSVCGLLTSGLGAQTTSLKATWTMGEVPSVAQGYTYTLKDAGTSVPLGSVSCSVAGSGAACSAPLNGPLPTVATHTLVLTAANAFGATDSAPLSGVKPGTPAGFTITVTVTVGTP